jgi:hypothetical protein
VEDCESLWEQTKAARELRESAIRKCLEQNSKTLPIDIKKATESVIDLRKDRVIYERTQFFESELDNENILWNTSVKNFLSRCRGLNLTSELLRQYKPQSTHQQQQQEQQKK